MSAFTKGPWSIQSSGCGFHVQETGGITICFCPASSAWVSMSSTVSVEEARANAALIAAAPDLLEALITLAREEWRDDDDLVLVAARAQAKEAIAKATGMAP